MAEGVSAVPSPADVAVRVAERTFTQTEVDEIVQSRLKNMKAEYEQVQARAASAQDLESRNQQLVSELSSLQLENLRVRIAAEFGIGSVDRDILLTATDEGMLRMQAERFAGLVSQRLVGGNLAPREGGVVQRPEPSGESMRESLRELFDSEPMWD
ncbi:hypothetical protein [Leucobacter chromiireducens]|uniref:Uncharacterized protein n=1 Tax=Leucobacter chromiireducens subsp. chromiireducens TaxID=660067 RepID=A0ABS1SMY9_9MICO|nr:hypothetical protein [Leucobacter chromiireducens]MBL3688955.1 hypothetical protein [Leucobacter chromiireducens subsp. chromiireducens]